MPTLRDYGQTLIKKIQLPVLPKKPQRLEEFDYKVMGWDRSIPFPTPTFTVWGEWNPKNKHERKFVFSPGLEELPFDHRPIAVDLFSGCGGFSLGLVQAGWRIVAAVEFSYYPMLTYISNIPCFQDAPLHFYFMDIQALHGQDILKALGGRKVDCVVGSPPCQSFSSCGKRAVGDTRDNLLWEFGRLIKEIQPKTYVMENVPGIMSKALPSGEGVLPEFLRYMEAGEEQINKAEKHFQESRKASRKRKQREEEA